MEIGGGCLRRLEIFLHRKSFFASCFVASLSAFLPSLFLVWAGNKILTLVVHDWRMDRPTNIDHPIFMLIIFGPVIETFALGAVISLISKISSNRNRQALFSALAWGGLHGLVYPFWFVGTFWTFFVLSIVYIDWREKSFWHGFAIASIVHALVNLSGLLVGRIERSLTNLDI